MTKPTRLDALRVILANRTAGTQADLIRELAAAGFPVSQPTLSLDLKKLRAMRVRTRDGYHYTLPDERTYARPVPPAVLPGYLHSTTLTSVAFAGPLLVLHTRPGYAPGIAADIDAQALPSVAGTVAGTDTVFVACADGADRQLLIDDLATVLPALKTVLP